MTPSQRLQVEQSEKRQRVNELLALDELDDAHRTELTGLTTRLQQIEPELRAALVVEPEPVVTPLGGDVEGRARRELRSRARVTNFLMAALRGRSLQGAERELADEINMGDGSIPLELWDTPRREEHRADVVSAAPGTVGVNLDPIRPQIFARSVLPRIGVAMPRVPSGTFASATISTGLSAATFAKGGDAMSTAAVMTPTSASPKRISGRLSIALEDVAAVGTENFESALRENLSMVMSDALDTQGLAGNGSGNNLTGVLQRLSDPTDPTAVATFDAMVAAFAGGIDGLWASNLREVAMVVGPASYRLMAKTFRDATADLGEKAFADYAMMYYGGLWTNKRMPDPVSTIQPAVLYRMAGGEMTNGGPIRTATLPIWSEIGIDDIYSSSGSGTRHFTMHIICGDVILVQPDAYAEVRFKVA